MAFIGISSLTTALTRIYTRTYDVRDMSNFRDWLVANMVPAGSVLFIASSASLPDGWLYAEGGSFDAGIYPDLYAALGSTTLPDLRDRIPIGIGTHVTSLLGTAGNTNITLETAQLPAHSHGVSDPGHSHSVTGDIDIPYDYTAGLDATILPGDVAEGTQAFSASLTAEEGTTGISIGDAGGGEEIDILPPVIGLRPIIKA